MKQYLELVQEVLDKGVLKDPARSGMPKTLEIFNRTLKVNLQDGLPLLTTKKVSFKNIIVELLWFLKGYTTLDYLHRYNCHIWDQDAYKYYVKNFNKLNKGDDFRKPKTYNQWIYEVTEGIRTQSLGNVYGHQWRRFGGGFDQIKYLVDNIKNQPTSRYHLCTAWNPTDFLDNERMEKAALPACHMMFQLNTRQVGDNKYLDLMVLQRSCDLFLGVPYNLASYGVLCHILAACTGYLAGELSWVGNSIHLYENHLEQANEILKREPLALPQLGIQKQLTADLMPWDFEVEDFELINYKHHEAIKAPLSVGK